MTKLNTSLKVERLQAGDHFLFRFNCPGCREEKLETYPLGIAACCQFNLGALELKIVHKRLLAGTYRKPLKIKKALVQTLLAAQGPFCAYCQADFSDLGSYHVEHIVPLAAGGTNLPSNLCLACPPCNLVAGSKVFASFEAKRDYVLTQRCR